MTPSDLPLVPHSEFLLYQTEDGRTRVQCRFEQDSLWLTQALIAELFQKDVRTINEHLVNIYDEAELSHEATLRKFRIVRTEGNRQVSRELEYGKYRTFIDTLPRPVDVDFEQAVKKIPKPKSRPG